MMGTWIAYALLIGSLLAGTARTLEGVCRLGTCPARWVWAGALALTLVLVGLAPHRAILGRTRAPSGVAMPGREAAVRSPVGRTFPDNVFASMARVRRAVTDPVQSALALAGQRLPTPIDHGLAALWLSLSTALLLLFSGVYYRLHRVRRSWPVTWLHGVRVRIAPEAGPAVIGLARPEIVVPRWLLDLGPEAQQLVLAHEREHVRARDPLLLAAACAVAAVLPWHPAAWWMVSRLRLAVELDCDGRVLRRGVAPRAYGELLIDLAGHRSGFRVGAIALADNTPSHLERRITAMQPGSTRFAPARAGALGAFALLSLLVACEAKLPTAAEVSVMDVAAAERGAGEAALLRQGDASAVYTVDGTEVTAAEARALPADQIGAIEVMRSNTAGDKAQIRITRRQSLAAGDAAAGPPSGTKLRLRDAGPGPDGATARTPERVRFEENFHGVVLIDGVRADAVAMRAFSPGEILSIEVIKGPAAANMYVAPEAANGVVRITTRGGAAKSQHR